MIVTSLTVFVGFVVEVMLCVVWYERFTENFKFF